MPRQRLFPFLVLASGLAIAPARSQETPAPREKPAADAASDAAEKETGGVREVGPTIFYAWDEESKSFRAIVDTSIAELQRLAALRDKRPDEAGPQRFHFTETGAVVAGTADGKRAELTLNLGIETNDEDWVAVPLRLNGAVLQSASFNGPGSHYIQYDETSGHVAWIWPKAKEAKYQLELKLLAPLAQVGEETRLDLKLPRVSPIKLSLAVATPGAQGAVRSGAQITSTAAQGDGTRFDVQASSSDLWLAWQGTREPTAVQRPSVFDAVGKILVNVESPTRITWDATFTVTVQQGEISTITVRLPPGATLITDEPAIRPSMEDQSKPKKPLGQLIDVELERPLQKGGSREIRLVCERLIPPRGESKLAAIEVGGFDVQNAAQQRGHIGLVVNDAWRCDATPGVNVARDDVLPEGFREAGVLGSDVYRYISRPHALAIDISPRRKKLTLAPIYLFDVQPDRVMLDARLRYQVLGARTDACRVDLPGWEIEAVELVQPSTPETREPIDFDPFATEPLAINLPRTMRGEFELRIRARHELPVDVIDFSAPLPRPAADELEPAIVVVQAADNIELRYQGQTSRGLMPVESAPPVQLAPRQQSPLVFHERLDEPDAVLAAEIDIRSREIAAASLTQVELGENFTTTRQRLEYNVRFEPLRRIVLAAPQWLPRHESLQVAVNGSALPRSAISFREADDEAADTSLMQIELPEPLLGAFSLEVKHSLPMSPLEQGIATALTVTVLTPVDEPLTLQQNRVEVQAAPHIRVELSDKNWLRRDAPAASGALAFESTQAAARLELVTTYNEPRPRRTTVVEKLWLQSWVAGNERRERAVFELRTNSDQIEFTCPTSLSFDKLVLVVNGVDVVPRAGDERRLLVDLPSAGAAPQSELRKHVVEFCWPFAEQAAGGSLRLDPPQIAGVWVRQAYWHLVLPRQKLALATPHGLSPEMIWKGWGWQSPRLAQPQLEAWCGATQQAAPSDDAWAMGSRQYLYSGVGEPAEIQLATQNAAAWMLGLSLLALGAVATLLLVPVTRHPAALLAVGGLLLALALWWPALAVLAAQCVALVIALAVAARLLESYLWRRRLQQRPLGALFAAPIVARRRRAVESSHEASARHPSTTATAALSLPLAPEAKT